MPITWKEVERGIAIEEFRIDNAPARIANRGDLWAKVVHDAPKRFDLGRFLQR